MDALGLSPPTQLSFDGNLGENWRRWKRNFENYLLAINSVTEPIPENGVIPVGNVPIWRRQVAILRHCIGEEAVEILDQFEFDTEADPAEDGDRLPDVLLKFENYFNPRRNTLFEWYVFWSLNQAEHEPIDMFVKRLKTQAAMCEFGDQKEMMILCRCVFGISDSKLKEKLLQNRDITLAVAINTIRAAEVTKTQLESMASKMTIASLSQQDRPTPPTPAPRKISCKYCGYDHVRGKCPAYGQNCKKCNKKNHFAKVCTSKVVNTLETNPNSKYSMNELFIGLIGNEVTKGTWIKHYDVAHGRMAHPVSFKIDTGAEANILSLDIAKKLNADILPSTAGLVSYTKHRITNHGKTKLRLHSRDQNEDTDVWFELVDDDLCPVLGLKTSVELGIVKRVDTVTTESIIDKFSDCFEGVGCLEREHKIRVDPQVRPVINRARRIPLSMTTRVKSELDKMEEMDIISRVDEPTEWVSSMVVTEKKDGSVRICLDPKPLNQAILREHHHIPTLEDIAHKFADMKIFTIMDMKHAYWHVPLDRNSRLLTTFNTPFGRYCFKRLPFGVNSAAEVFEKRVEEIFGDLNVAIYFDDLIVFGRNQEEHDVNLHELLERAREKNVKFNRQKMQLNCSEVRYLGHIVSAKGLRPDPDKVQAIKDMPDPKDKLGIQRLLGSLNFLRGFIPDTAEITAPLRALLKDGTVWEWGDDQRLAMSQVKKLLTSEPLLQYFDVSKETTLQVDSSQSGLGAVLMQDQHPIAYASRALTETEQDWPQIDKELLAIVYGFEKFRTYVYGRPIDVQTDHNPLVSIIRKSLHKASPRLQRLLLRLMKYQVRRVSYVPGKYLYLADTLSRAYISDDVGDIEEEIVMVHSLQMREDQMAALHSAYVADSTMGEVKDAIMTGWIWQTRKQAPSTIQPYWDARDELYIKNNLIYKNEQLLIPAMLRREYLKTLHKGHLGMQKSINPAKEFMFWPGMTSEVREIVSRCPTCQKFANQLQEEPLIPHAVPELPWNKVGMDIM
jgi:hypothetical protein